MGDLFPPIFIFNGGIKMKNNNSLVESANDFILILVTLIVGVSGFIGIMGIRDLLFSPHVFFSKNANPTLMIMFILMSAIILIKLSDIWVSAYKNSNQFYIASEGIKSYLMKILMESEFYKWVPMLCIELYYLYEVFKTGCNVSEFVSTLTSIAICVVVAITSLIIDGVIRIIYRYK